MAADTVGLSSQELSSQELSGQELGGQELGGEELGGRESSGSGSGVVRTRGLYRGFGERVVLRGIDLDIARGEFVALLGRSGSGKSTLLRALAELDYDVPGSGELAVPPERAVVFQDSRLLPWIRLLDNVTLGLRGRDAAERGRTALAEVGLAGRENAWPKELSGGEQQRVALFGALDALTRIKMHFLLQDLCARHTPAVLLVTHDVDEAVLLADRVLVLDEGRLVVDQRIELERPRRHSDPAFIRHRELLLSALGVDVATTGPALNHPHEEAKQAS
jgi:sulfonate transport system ATP-binding protein